MKIFCSTNNIFQYHPPPPPPQKKKKKKKKKRNGSIRLSRNYKKIVSKNVQNMKPVHIAHVSYFAQVLYFAHFSRVMFLAKAFWLSQ